MPTTTEITFPASITYDPYGAFKNTSCCTIAYGPDKTKDIEQLEQQIDAQEDNINFLSQQRQELLGYTNYLEDIITKNTNRIIELEDKCTYFGSEINSLTNEIHELKQSIRSTYEKEVC